MERSQYLAGLAGPVLALIGLSLLINHDLAPALAGQLSQDLGLVIVAGSILLVTGIAIVRAHNVWSGWPTVITVLGWLCVLGGALRILIPAQLAAWAPDMVRNRGFITGEAVVLLLIGLFLCLKAWRG